ncbi:carbohydrate kinase family protein [Streptomyces sp. NBC_01304]|uniref:carbohydrate kinase family protein n=1 Tax=Streptomyces sp. NBC_01304 TaxID=2903818 RepID=UPI002E0F648E|nr:carbohydrate kinase family protein [Streptomyces sp. NBC_01304]
MPRTIVIGNISRDHIHRPGLPPAHQLGGAALHLSVAAARAGQQIAPASVIGADLARLTADPRLPALDWSLLRHDPKPSASFTIHYDDQGTVADVDTAYGAAEHLTEHALRTLAHYPHDVFHVSCRRPLHVAEVLNALTAHGCSFSLDFHLPSAPQLIEAAAPWLRRATTVFVNAEEYALLAQVTRTRPCPEVVVTDGPRPARVLLHGRALPAVVPPPVTVRQITGAGDTLAGTYLAHRARQFSPSDSLHQAVQAASRHTAQTPLILPEPRRSPS